MIRCFQCSNTLEKLPNTQRTHGALPMETWYCADCDRSLYKNSSEVSDEKETIDKGE